MLSQGPIIRALEILTAVTGLVSLAALGFAFANFEGRIDTIQTARERSAFDNCEVLTALVLNSAGREQRRYAVRDPQGRLIGYLDTGPLSRREHAARLFLTQVKLSNCRRYALLVRTGRVPLVKLPPTAIGHRRGRSPH